MAGIQTAIRLNDQMSAQLNNIISAINRTIQACNNLDSASTDALQGTASSSAQAAMNVNQLVVCTNQAANSQRQYNQAVKGGSDAMNGLIGKVKTLVGAYLGIQTAKGIIETSDALVSTTARLNNMNESFRKSAEKQLNVPVNYSMQQEGTVQKQATQTVQYTLEQVGGIEEQAGITVPYTLEPTNTVTVPEVDTKTYMTAAETTEAIFQAAQRARGEFQNMADAVAKFGNNAGDAFSGTEEVIAFTELVQKQFAIAGASGTEASNAMLQLSQALGSGVLRGDELRSIFEQAPNLIQSIATYMDVPIGQIRTLAEEGKLTADIVKNSLLSQASEINEKFEKMPLTWSQAWAKSKNAALMAFTPVLNRINDTANSEALVTMTNVAINAVQMFSSITLQAFDAVNSEIDWCKSNWDTIGPIIYSAAAAVAIYTTAVTAATTATKIWNVVSSSMFLWIAGIGVAVYAVYELASYIAQMSDVASTAFGVICGWVNVVIQFFKNFGLAFANTGIGIAQAATAVAYNLNAAFFNSINAVKGYFYGLMSAACSCIASIAASLNQLPFISFDFSGIQGKADEYAAAQAAASGSQMEYQNVGAALESGYNTYQIDYANWKSNAFAEGAALGDGIANKVSAALNSWTSGSGGGGGGTAYDYGALLEGINNSGADTAGNTGKSAKALTATTEDLKYLRDIAERDVINRFTTAQVNVDLGGIVNNVSGNTDLDGMVSYIAESLREALYTTAEGVHV